MNYRDKIRKSIECPQLCNSSYGEWGLLRIDQKRNIKRLLDELDSADDYIKKLYKEKKELIDYLKKEKKEQEYKKNTSDFGLDIVYTKGKIKAYEEILSKIEKR